jgi:hypothetical protein
MAGENIKSRDGCWPAVEPLPTPHGPGGPPRTFDVWSDESADRLLGLLLVQAMSDGMDAMRLTADTESGTVRLIYARSVGRESWDMTPPPRAMYGALVRSVVSHTEFGDDVCGRGVLALAWPGGAREVHVDVGDWRSVSLWWNGSDHPAT